MFGRKSLIPLILVLIVPVFFMGTGCGVRILQNLPGNEFADVRYEITGSANIGSAEIIFCDHNLSETVLGGAALPWTYECRVDLYYPSFYYSLHARSAAPVELASGTSDRWNGFIFEDSGAAFSETAAPGDYVFNRTDGVCGKIASVDSGTALTLDCICFSENKRAYKIYQSMNRRISGLAGGPEAFKLIDASIPNLFIVKGVVVGDKVFNSVTGAAAVVTSAPEGSRLTLSLDIFPIAGQRYAVYNATNEIRGITDTVAAFKLIDGTKQFKTGAAPVSPGAAAARGAAGPFSAFAKILSVDSETTLTLDKDIFTDVDDYVIFNYDQDEAFSTAQQANKLIDSSARFCTDATAECIVYNLSSDGFTDIVSIDSDTVMTLTADLFPTREIEYVIYAMRALTLSIYINDALYKTVTSQWWNEVEVQSAGTISSQEIRDFLQ